MSADIETTEYPLRTDHLSKGSIVPAHDVEAALGVVRGTEAYQLAAMRASAYIAQRLEERGEVVTVIQRNHDLVVLTDEEASEYNARQFTIALRKAARSHRRALGVDRAALTPERLKEHDRNLETNGRVLSAIRKERALMPRPRERETPAYLPPSKDEE